MPGRDAQWVIGTIVAAIIALSVQMGGIGSDLAEIRADMREMRGGIRSLDDRLRAVEIAFGKSTSGSRRWSGCTCPRLTPPTDRHRSSRRRAVGLASDTIRYGVSAYAMVENYRCTEVPETSSRVGLSLMLARDDWPVRPALRSGLNHGDDGDVSFTVSAGLTFGQRYGTQLGAALFRRMPSRSFIKELRRLAAALQCVLRGYNAAPVAFRAASSDGSLD